MLDALAIVESYRLWEECLGIELDFCGGSAYDPVHIGIEA